MTRTSFTTTSRTVSQIARRGQSICPMDETLTAEVAAAPVRIVTKPDGRKVRVGTDYSHPAMKRVPSVGATVVPVTETDPTAERKADLIRIGHAAITSTDETGKWDKGATWHSLGAELCQEVAVVLMRADCWKKYGPNQKATVADYIIPEWEVDPADYTHYWFYSGTRDNLRHQLKFNPATGEMQCDCEAAQNNLGCYHTSLFTMRYRDYVMMQYEASPTREEESIYRADAESETGRLGTSYPSGHAAVNPDVMSKDDFDQTTGSNWRGKVGIK